MPLAPLRLLRSAAPWWPETLVPSASRAGLAEAAAGVDVPTEVIYVEVRLARGDDRADFMTVLTRGGGAPTLAADRGQLDQDADWQRVGAFLDLWLEPASALGAFVPLAWLEFDLPDRRPQVGFCVDPSLRPGLTPLAEPPDIRSAAFLDPVLAGAEALFGDALDPVERALLARLVAALPPGAHPVHLGVSTSRSPAVLRWVDAVPRDRVIPYLAAIGWPGLRDAESDLRVLLDALPDDTRGRLKIDVDFGGGLQPRFGAFAELSLRRGGGREALVACLAHWVERGWCDPDKARALPGWLGHHTGSEGLFGPRRRVRRLLDLKLVRAPSGRVEAKAYLGLAAT